MALERGSEVGKFDRYAETYTQAHAASVRASGEPPEYFARHKLGCLERLGVSERDRILDYGCGTGNLLELLAERFGLVSGFDPSERSLERARERAPEAALYASEAAIPEAAFDVVILSGVLHHVPPAERRNVLAMVYEKLAPGGRLVIFEHNPYNPLTVRAVRACPFDDDAVLLSPRELRRLLAEARLGAIRQRYVLFFPRALAMLRPLEPWLAACPLGAQTLTSGVRL